MHLAEVLARIHLEAGTGDVEVSRQAQGDITGLGYDHHDVCDCLAELRETDFHKEAESKMRPGVRLYVFRTLYCEDDLYVKVALNPEALYVLSFKLWGAAG